MRVRRSLPLVAVFTFFALPVLAAPGGLDGLISKIEEVNTWLVTLGAALSVTGFIWALLAMIVGMAGLARAVVILLVGLVIASAPEIVSFLVG